MCSENTQTNKKTGSVYKRTLATACGRRRGVVSEGEKEDVRGT